jgi:hypothetical protein
MSNIKQIIKTPLTDGDLERFLGADVQNNIVKYSDLDEFEDLEQLLPHNNSYKIILIEYEKNNGHWLCMLRYGKTIEIFNSFGTKHDEEDFIESNLINDYLGQSFLHLNILIRKELDEEKFNMIYNKIRFQVKHKSVNTCGRHVVNRIICLLHYDMTLNDYIQFMKKAIKKTKLSYDELVSTIIV